jgi:hypothetical protein
MTSNKEKILGISIAVLGTVFFIILTFLLGRYAYLKVTPRLEKRTEKIYLEFVGDSVQFEYFVIQDEEIKNSDLKKYKYKNGLKHGKVKLYYRSGNLLATTNFYTGQLHGTLTIYSENGEILSKSKYSKGRLVTRGQGDDTPEINVPELLKFTIEQHKRWMGK